MKFLSTIIFFLFLNSVSDLQIKTIIPVKASKIYVDNFDNLYLVSGNSLMKYNSDGKELFVFDSPYDGKMSFVDLKNPMKILVFFGNRNKIIFLNNQLSIIGDEILLENINVFGEALVCGTESGGVWIVDIANKILIKYNSDFKEIFRKDLFEISGTPEYMIAEDNSLFIKTKNNIISVYDNLGNYNFKIEKKNVSEFSINGTNLQFFNQKTNALTSYNFETGDSLLINLPDTIKINNAIQSPHYVYFNDKNKVYISEIVNEKINKQ